MIADFIVYPVYFITIFVSVFYLVTYFQSKKYFHSNITTRFPFITIIMPAYNEEQVIADSITGLLNIDYPKDKFKVIVVDDGSKDDTYNLAKEFEGGNVFVYTKKNEGKAAAMNFGIDKAEGEFMVTIDADSYMDPDLLKKAIPYFDDPEVGLAVPTLKPHKPKKIIEKIQLMEYVMSSFNRKVLTFIGSMLAAPACTIFRAQVFKKIGKFDVGNLTEDFEIALRAQKHNYKLAHILDSTTHTHVPDTLKKLFRQRLRWDYGTFYNLRKHRQLFSLKYGDLGIFYLPVFVIAIGIGILIYSLFTYDWLTRFIRRFHLLSLTNFDLDLSGLSPWDFVPGARVILGVIVLIFALLLYRYSKKYTNEKRVNLISLTAYFTIFNFGMVIIWIVALFYFILGKKPKW